MMYILKDSKRYEIKKILAYSEYPKVYYENGIQKKFMDYDIEFEDQFGMYRHWKSWDDGGCLIKTY